MNNHKESVEETRNQIKIKLKKQYFQTLSNSELFRIYYTPIFIFYHLAFVY